MSEEERKTGSSQSGNTSCYQAEYLSWKIVDGIAEEDWKPIEVKQGFEGVPVSKCHGEFFAFLSYQSYEQAQAVCWWFLSCWEARPFDIDRMMEKRPAVRIRTYDFVYSLKTYHREIDNIYVDPGKQEEVNDE